MKDDFFGNVSPAFFQRLLQGVDNNLGLHPRFNDPSEHSSRMQIKDG